MRMMTVRPYARQSLVMGYQSMGTLCPVNKPQTAMTPKMLKTALPTIVPIPRSLSVTKVPMMLVKNSGELVPKLRKYCKNYLQGIVSCCTHL